MQTHTLQFGGGLRSLQAWHSVVECIPCKAASWADGGGGDQGACIFNDDEADEEGLEREQGLEEGEEEVAGL